MSPDDKEASMLVIITLGFKGGSIDIKALSSTAILLNAAAVILSWAKEAVSGLWGSGGPYQTMSP